MSTPFVPEFDQQSSQYYRTLLTEKKQRLQSEIEFIDNEIERLELWSEDEGDEAFDEELSRFDKANMAIKKNNKPMTTNDIVAYIGRKYEPGTISTPVKLRDTVTKYATSLKIKIDLGNSALNREQIMKGAQPTYYYGLAEWFTNGKLIDEYRAKI